MSKVYNKSEIFGGGCGMFDTEILSVGTLVALEDGTYVDTEGAEIQVKNGAVVAFCGYGFYEV